jgi:glutamine synthetase
MAAMAANTPTSLSTPIHRDAEASIAALEADGVTTVIGTVVNPAGLTLAKTIPVGRLGAFADPGLGASPVWHVFAIDKAGVVVGNGVTPVGDERIRLDTSALYVLGDGLAWAPGSFFHQDGTPDPYCSRGALDRIEQRLVAANLEATVGHEMEFVLVGADGSALPSHLWAQYGLAGVLEFEGFVRHVTEDAVRCGVAIEQFHPEYGANQFEISLAPRTPVTAADHLVLMRIIISRAARRHGMRVSLSPVPFAGSVGSGAHQHFSLRGADGPLFSGGVGAHAMTAAGESALAGLLMGLPEAQGVLCGSILSGLRMAPGMWSGAYVCWGTDNREAAARFLPGGPANPHGANVEVKVVDPSANPYFATAAILGLALNGIEQQILLGPETMVDPATLSEEERSQAGTRLLPGQADALASLATSSLMRDILGNEAVDAIVAVRRYEQETFADLPAEELAEKFRLSWSV